LRGPNPRGGGAPNQQNQRAGNQQQPVRLPGKRNPAQQRRGVETQALGGADVEKQENKSGEGEIGKKANVNKFGDFIDVVCYNYGTPGHHKAQCKKPKTCFICKKENHVTDSCPIRKEGHMSAAYVGSAASGLGFYLIKVPEGGDRGLWISLIVEWFILRRMISLRKNCS
jgi:hypothetical protein